MLAESDMVKGAAAWRAWPPDAILADKDIVIEPRFAVIAANIELILRVIEGLAVSDGKFCIREGHSVTIIFEAELILESPKVMAPEIILATEVILAPPAVDIPLSIKLAEVMRL